MTRLPLDSVESLQVLLLLRRSPDTFWRIEALSQQLGIARDVLEAKVTALLDAHLVVRGAQTGAYRYAPANEELHESVRRALDSADLIKLQAFADAFKLKDHR